nr:transposase [Acetivibrio cellulolyticus]
MMQITNDSKPSVGLSALVQEYNIQSAEDVQETLKNLLGGNIQSILEAEVDQHLGYKPYERTDSTNSRNSTKPKKELPYVASSSGSSQS